MSSYPDRMEHLTILEAAHMLGLPPAEARHLLYDHQLAAPRSHLVTATTAAVEELAPVHYPWKQHVHDPQSYWLTVSQAAGILGVSVQRVKQFLEKDALPYETTNTGVRLMRRHQLEVVANVRLSRALQR